MNPKAQIIPDYYLGSIVDERSMTTGVGIAEISGTVYPVAKVYDCMVIFPSFSDKDPYSKLEKSGGSTDDIKYCLLNMSESHRHVAPMGLLYGQHQLIVPDKSKPQAEHPVEFLFIKDMKGRSEWGHRISKEEYDRLGRLDNSVEVKIEI